MNWKRFLYVQSSVLIGLSIFGLFASSTPNAKAFFIELAFIGASILIGALYS